MRTAWKQITQHKPAVRQTCLVSITGCEQPMVALWYEKKPVDMHPSEWAGEGFYYYGDDEYFKILDFEAWQEMPVPLWKQQEGKT